MVRIFLRGKDGLKERKVDEWKDCLGREGWFRKGRMVDGGKNGRWREGWFRKGKMVGEGTSSKGRML